MRYAIALKIRHDYGTPSPHARTLVRLMPADLPERQIVSLRRLAVNPFPDERREDRDFFGNITIGLAFHRPIRRVELTLLARAERIATPPSLDLSPGLDGLASEVSANLSLGAQGPLHYLGPSPRIGAEPEIEAFARGLVTPGMTAMQALRTIGDALHEAIRFDPGATDVHTPPGEAFTARHGVCQDISHIMIAALRGLGIPAGYVSGFLRTLPPPGQERLAGADAMHAWVCAWCGADAGWIEYDPTNACAVALDHVAVAYGRDYGDVAPVRGVLRTAGAQVSEHAVDMEPVS